MAQFPVGQTTELQRRRVLCDLRASYPDSAGSRSGYCHDLPPQSASMEWTSFLWIVIISVGDLVHQRIRPPSICGCSACPIRADEQQVLTIIQGTMDTMDRVLPSAFLTGCVERSPGSPLPALTPFVFFSAVFSSFQLPIPKRVLLRRSALYCNRRSQWFLIVPVTDAHPPLNDEEEA